MRLGDVCDILNGYAFRSEQYVDEGIRIIRIANVQKGYIEDSAPVFYPYDSGDAKKYILEEGDILMSLTGNVGRVAKLSKEFLPATLNQRVACLRIKDGVSLDKAFLFNLLNSDYFEQQCIAVAKGVAQKNMSTEWLKEYEIPMFPLEQQKKIATVLDKIHQLIALRKAQLAKLDELVKSRFIELFGDPESNPFNWQRQNLGNLLLIERGGSPRPIDHYITESEDGVNWIKIGDAQPGSIYITATKQRIRTDGCKKSRHVKPGDFILSNSMSFGRPYIMKIDGYIHDGWLLLRDENNRFNKLFLHSMLSSNYTYNCFKSMAEGGVVNNLNKELVGKLVVYIPPMELQNEFAAFVEHTDKLKLAIQASLVKLELLKKALMQKYFG